MYHTNSSIQSVVSLKRNTSEPLACIYKIVMSTDIYGDIGYFIIAGASKHNWTKVIHIVLLKTNGAHKTAAISQYLTTRTCLIILVWAHIERGTSGNCSTKSSFEPAFVWQRSSHGHHCSTIIWAGFLWPAHAYI